MDNQTMPPQVPDNQTPPTIPDAFFRRKKGLLAALISIAVFLVLAGGAFGYYLAQKKNSNPQPQTNPDVNQPQSNNNNPAATSTPAAQATADCQNPLPPVASKSGTVQWQNPGLLDTQIFGSNGDPNNYFDHEEDYKIGHIISGTYNGGDILIVKVYYNEPGGPSLNYVVHAGTQYVFLTKVGPVFPDLQNSGVKTLVSVTQDGNYFPADLQNIPDKLHLDNPKTDFTLTPANYYSGQNFFCSDGLVKVFTDPAAGDVYTDASLQVPNAYGTFNQTPQGFYVKSPDGLIDTYQMTIPIIGKDNVPDVIWSNGQKNAQEYAYQHVGGCGSSNYRDVADVNLSDLQQVGSASDGNQVYGYKDPQTQELKDFYEGIYVPDGQAKISYAGYIAGHPIFFWKDPFGKFIRFHNKQFQPMAECGKPVIYLYPPKTEKISVQLNPIGGFSYTEPAYNSGWNVISDPNSNITNLADGQSYPYLFWEGRGGYYQTPDKGFVVEQTNVHEFLQTKLHELGLNDKESADFMDFWEPKMQGSPYYFVTFMGNSVMDQLAPLSITPKPDTVIRILMDFKPLQHPVDVMGYNISTPVRKGFTVVEWGGVLR